MGAGIVNAAAAVAAAALPVSNDDSTLLVSRQALGSQNGVAGEALLYSIVVPSGRTSLNLRTYGGSGDVSIYVKRGAPATTASYDRTSAKAGNSETVVIGNPVAGTYYLLVVGAKAFANVSVLGVF